MFHAEKSKFLTKQKKQSFQPQSPLNLINPNPKPKPIQTPQSLHSTSFATPTPTQTLTQICMFLQYLIDRNTVSYIEFIRAGENFKTSSEVMTDFDENVRSPKILSKIPRKKIFMRPLRERLICRLSEVHNYCF